MSPVAGLPRPAVVGMVHLLPLPGAPRWGGDMGAVLARALDDAGHLAGAGLDGLMVENFGDVPYFPGPVPEETVAAMAVVTAAVRERVDVPVGVNVLRNGGPAALAVAAVTGAAWIRVNVHVGSMFTDQGLLHGQAHETLRRRAALGAHGVAVLADVLVKHGTPPPGMRLEDAASDARTRGLADGLVVSGSATGRPTDVEDVRRVKRAVPDAPVFVGSGATAESARALLLAADGLIVGSTLQRDGIAGRPVDPERARRFMDALLG